MGPLVTFVFPAHAGGLPLLRRSVLALDAQTADPSAFEVVVAVDGEGLDEVASALRQHAHRFSLRVVESQRTAGNEHLPHRNHARRAGCDAARGEYLWVLDADVIADRHAVDHLRAVADGRTRPVVLSPCLAEPRCSPAAWLRQTGPFVEHADAASLMATAQSSPKVPWTSSAQLRRYRRGPPRSIWFGALIEGQPVFPRAIYDALGGFDLRFLGYGGNKVSLVRQLTILDTQHGLVEVRLLTSCCFFHQPHDRDPLRFDEAHRQKNWALYNELVAGARRGDPWWMERVDAVRAATGRA